MNLLRKRKKSWRLQMVRKMTLEEENDFNVREEYRKRIEENIDNIVPFAELDECRWKELIGEFKKALA